MPHGIFLTFLIALATGFLALAWVARRSHHHYSPVTEALIPPLLHYNLWVMVWLVLNYVEGNVLGDLDSASGQLLLAALVWVSMAAALLWAASYLGFTLQAAHSANPEALLRRTRQWAVLLVVGTALASLVLWFLGLAPAIRTLSRGVSSLVFLSVAIFSLGLFFSAHRQYEEASSRNLRLLGAAYSCLFVALTLFVGWRRVTSQVPRNTSLMVHLSLEILYNLITVLWIHFFDRQPLALSSPHEAVVAALPQATASFGFGISKREQEVIQLICRGLTNQEIADTLFISLKTVKDHNYHIFQKTGVRNRVELVQLAQKNPGTERAG
jgi:DNA-binding CsgD family transcriptional regulator